METIVAVHFSPFGKGGIEGGFRCLKSLSVSLYQKGDAFLSFEK
jgi:hypothetical protein